MSRFFLAQLSQLKGFAKKILPQRLSQYHYRAFFVFLLVVFFGLSTKYVHAGFVEWIVEAISSMLLALANIAVALTIFFLRYFITLASYNNYIDVSVVKLGWVMVRDVANMFFVVFLLIIAFATILGIEKYEWKKGLVKLIMMAILINFSNLIAQIIIDAAHVFTITFLNAVSASAGGNLINMFSMDKITSLIQGKSVGDTLQSATTSIFAASFVAFLFAVGTAVALGSYLIVMVLRVVVLWALIILSPLAYLLSALPNGEQYAKKWWSEFTKHVIVAPVMVFFLWLSFATLGTGQIMSEVQTGSTIPLQQSSDALSVSLTDISTWEKMANYILALVFLMIGLKMTKETGATGSGLAGTAENFIKKAGTIASGYATGRWLAGKGYGHGKSLLGKGLRGVGKGVGKYVYHKSGASRGVERVKAALAEGKMNRLKLGTDMAKRYEEKANESTGVKSAFNRFMSWSSNPVQRSQKQAEDWKKTAEAFKEIQEESYSTSDTVAGQRKQRAYTERDDVKAKAAAKVREKQEQQKTLVLAMQLEMEQMLKGEHEELNAPLKAKLDKIEAEKQRALKVAEQEGKDDEGKDKPGKFFTEEDEVRELAELESEYKTGVNDINSGTDTDDEKKTKLATLKAKYETDKEATVNKLAVSDERKKTVTELFDKQIEQTKAEYVPDFAKIRDARIEKVNVEFEEKIDNNPNMTKEERKKLENTRNDRIQEVEASYKIASGIKVDKEKIRANVDKEFEEEEKRVNSMKDGDDKKKALAKIVADKLKAVNDAINKTFNKEFNSAFKEVLLDTRSDELFEKVASKMSNGDPEATKKRKRVLKQNYSTQDLWRYSEFVTNEKKVAAKSGAGAEELGKATRQGQERDVAFARDKVRVQKGGKAVFSQQVEDKHEKERQEELAPLNYREITSQGAELAKKIQENITKGLKIDPAMQADLTSIVSSAMSRGSEEGAQAMEGILEAIGFKEKISSGDMLGQQRKFLSTLLGRKVEKKDGEDESITVKKAFEELQGIHGKEKTNAMMKNLDTATKSAGADGLLHSIGLFDDKNLDENGRVIMKMQTSYKGFEESREYMAQRQKPSNLTGLDGIANKTMDGEITIKVVGADGKSTDKVDHSAKKSVIETLNNIKGNTQLTTAFKTQLQNLFESDKVAFEDILGELSEASRDAVTRELKGYPKDVSSKKEKKSSSYSGSKKTPKKGSGGGFKKAVGDAFKD